MPSNMQHTLEKIGPDQTWTFEDTRRISEKIGPDRTWTFEDPRRIEEYQRRLDQTGPGHLKTPEEYECPDWEEPVMIRAIPVQTGPDQMDSCACSKPVDLKTQCVLSAGCFVWEKPAMTAVSKPVDLKMQKEMKTAKQWQWAQLTEYAGHGEIGSDVEDAIFPRYLNGWEGDTHMWTWRLDCSRRKNQTCRQDCVKEDGEE
ncbi:hypothetical protein Bbelb_016410 [Branchiostoma belcheri]|nr:hypothetical protein Bbelb_016410 [Branchiostoma belcheri]